MPDDSFKEFVLDQLGALPELRARTNRVGGESEEVVEACEEMLSVP